MSKMELPEAAANATVHDTSHMLESCPRGGVLLTGGGKVEIPGSKADAEKLMHDKVLPQIMLHAKDQMDKITHGCVKPTRDSFDPSDIYKDKVSSSLVQDLAKDGKLSDASKADIDRALKSGDLGDIVDKTNAKLQDQNIPYNVELKRRAEDATAQVNVTDKEFKRTDSYSGQ